MSRPTVRELHPTQAYARLRAGARLIDIREAGERAGGMAEGAVGVARTDLEAEPGRWLTGQPGETILICARGTRSFSCAERLIEHGYTGVSSVSGGIAFWVECDLPMQPAEADADFLQRYARHLSLPEISLSGQRRLAAATVGMVGAGGLGSPAGFYLAAAGVGRIRIADPDSVERSNLQRQILHTDAGVGQGKAHSAARALSALNPSVRIEPLPERIDAANVESFLDGVDVVIDGADNFAARYLLSDACVKLGKPLVYGAVERFQGQVSVFDAGRQRGQAPCYRCLFPSPPPARFAPNCAEAGVLGVLPGVIGLLQATEAIKLILQLGEPLTGRLLHFDAKTMRFRETRLRPDPDCPVCAPGRAFPGYIDYAQFCSQND
ncbi:MAG: molybdopterin-synthase adenylyltransferase MoeB [Xanthomonadaceae bacterium]|nr:molybdopterin-synthase adenylyltransferase MoeB [Xanthomonadaceae bacterium]